MDYVVWIWLNILTTLVLVVLAIEQFTLTVASPIAVLFYAIVGWFVIQFMLEISDTEKDFCIGESIYWLSFIFGMFIQVITVYYLAWNQWLLTGNMFWLYAPLVLVVYWLAQITYWIAMNFRCVVEE